jgi:nicotinamidase-related amidase
MRIKREDCIGLVIDIQESLFPVMAEKELLSARCSVMVEGLQILGIPILFTQQYTRGLGETISEISSSVSSFSYVEKSSFSCMDEPAFISLLEHSGKKTVVIGGIESHVCVLQTAVDLREKGYRPVILSDCISSRSLAEKQIALNRFNLEEILVSTSESVLFELTRFSGTPEFKAISKLIK